MTRLLSAHAADTLPRAPPGRPDRGRTRRRRACPARMPCPGNDAIPHENEPGPPCAPSDRSSQRSEEHTSELQSLMRISYAVFCLKKKKKKYIKIIESLSHTS